MVVLIVAACVGPSPSLFAAVMGPAFDLGAGKPYAIIQLGNGLGGDEEDDDVLNIESNSSVFGSVLKGLDDTDYPDFKTQLSTSKVTDRWDIETGVVRDKTSSRVLAGGGTQNELTDLQMKQIRDDALAASALWAGESAANLTGAQHTDLANGNTVTLTGTTGGANVFNSTANFLINGAILELTGNPGDFFVFNIFPSQDFKINSAAEIKLSGDIEPEEVLFNVLGDVGDGGIDDAHIQGNSLFRGTLLAPERNVLVSQNHFDTFVSSGLLDDDGNFQAPSTTPISWQTATEGIFGQIVAGGKISWSESDIMHHPFMTIPEPASIIVWSLLGCVAIAVSRLRTRR